MTAVICKQSASEVKLLRRIFLLALLMLGLLWTAAAQAAQVTDVKWGVDKNNVLRLVVDVDATAGYATSLDGKTLTLTVNASKGSKVPEIRAVRSSLANKLLVSGKSSHTIVQLPLLQQISEKDLKAFVLKKDPATGRPFRVVLDITAAQTKAAATSSAKSSTSTAPVVSNKPVVSTKPTKQSGSQTSNAVKSTATAAATKATVNKAAEKQAAEKKKQQAKDAAKKNSKNSKQTTTKNTSTTQPAATVASFRTNGGLKDKIIVLDPGHGGSDPGAIGADGTKEKDITLPIAKLLQRELEDKGAKVYMTRTTDVDVYGPNATDAQELQARVDVAEKRKADLFVSLHINSSVNKSVGGFSSYYYPKTTYDLQIAQSIQKELAANFGVDDLGVRQANFYVIKRISMPATLLEMCFISNSKELELMKGNWFKKKTAKMICNGIEKYFG